ncbi:DNA-binding LytR/AlgR family response regulator [Filimonas zeae]|uniref:DNA-binding response regulator n=1 Tax=Filimonas zeae TaxID=1737353 RepID=A0A917MX10_9BACT|nr:LytTR family DNA-binding domain-containing protein [Filimonas zeae]MDR6340074.1 DNA-binding LytR/AlgR family response regulator [Filimonas zeae]GGH71010.1 DNA-binding response regulator [Filimonas zeae]
MIKAIAIDDEPVALDIIRNHAEKIPSVNLCATFLSASEAFNYIKSNHVDVVFADISMPGLSGLEFAEMVKHRVQVVFTTAYPEHALKGFELAATDYLLKPINFSRFLQATQLAESRMQPPAAPENLFVKDGHSWLALPLADLLYARGEDNYVSLYINDKRILTRTTLTVLQSKLPVRQFVRVHKSYIIALAKIEKIEKHQVSISDAKIPLSMLSAEELLQLLGTTGYNVHI